MKSKFQNGVVCVFGVHVRNWLRRHFSYDANVLDLDKGLSYTKECSCQNSSYILKIKTCHCM